MPSRPILTVIIEPENGVQLLDATQTIYELYKKGVEFYDKSHGGCHIIFTMSYLEKEPHRYEEINGYMNKIYKSSM
jgi:hypothetical protein